MIRDLYKLVLSPFFVIIYIFIHHNYGSTKGKIKFIAKG